jgi:hypothetical protein
LFLGLGGHSSIGVRFASEPSTEGSLERKPNSCNGERCDRSIVIASIATEITAIERVLFR